MKKEFYDIAIVGAGAAGLSAAGVCAQAGVRVLVIDRDAHPGGVLLQCIHSGFGLHYFKEELTGPEFAERLFERAQALGATFKWDHSVMELKDLNREKELVLYSKAEGVTVVQAKAVILAMGCRERNRGNLGIPGDRVAGIFTAGLAQRLLNIDGYIPGKKAVIVGSGDIGLIMARRLSWCGVLVQAVVEVLPHPSGLSRNIAQCLEDFHIPLYLSTTVTQIQGHKRVESITIAPNNDLQNTRTLDCDTVLFSVGLIPENELSLRCQIELSPTTHGAVVDGALMTNIPGIFACGNVLHVHDLVDFVAEEAQTCASHAVAYVKEGIPSKALCVPTRPNEGLAYVVPQGCISGKATRFYMRPKLLCNRAELTVYSGENCLLHKQLNYVKPAEMISIELSAQQTLGCQEELVFELKEKKETNSAKEGKA